MPCPIVPGRNGPARRSAFEFHAKDSMCEFETAEDVNFRLQPSKSHKAKHVPEQER
jgi:hypothetical protein